MDNSFLIALVTSGMSLLGVIITCKTTFQKSAQAQAVAQAVTNTKIENLTTEVRQHNNFAQQIPVLKAEIEELKRKVSVLERFHMQQN